MPLPRVHARAASAKRAGFRHRRRGVSEVIATILILALTVVLFAALFYFVSSFPSAPPQNVNEFQASLVYTTASGTSYVCGSSTTKLTSSGVCGITILQEAGPSVPNSDRVYLESTRTSTNWQFASNANLQVGWGIGNASGGWQTGEYWTEYFATAIATPENISVYIVSASQLLYSGVAPGNTASFAPVLSTTYTSPTTPSVGEAFEIFAFVSGNSTGLALNISLSDVPGLTSTVQTMTSAGGGEWTYSVASGATTTSGDYAAFIQGINTTGSTISGSVSIDISGTSTSSSGSLFVSVGLSPYPVTAPTYGTSEALAAMITYSGTSSTSISGDVWFNVSQTRPVSNTWPASDFQTSIGPIAYSIPSAPSTVTVYAPSSDNFTAWLLNLNRSSTCTTTQCTAGSTGNPTLSGNSPVVYANITLTGVGTASGSVSVGALSKTTLQAMSYFSTSTSTTGGVLYDLVRTFTNTATEYVAYSIWNNYSSTIYYSGTVYVNSSSTGKDTTGSPYTLACSSSTTTVTSASTKVGVWSSTKWSGGSVNNGYYVRMWLQVMSTSCTGPVIGYLYSSFQAYES